MADQPVSLDTLRQEIDTIDDAIHDLIMRRSDLADCVRQAKQHEEGAGVTYLRPGREAAVLRRLMARHKGNFPRRVLVRLWREIFSVSLSMQNRITLAVWMPERGAGYLDLAHNQYGSFTSASVHQSVRQVVQEVAEGRATLGILPLPRQGDAITWWPPLMSTQPGTPRVIARLPVTGPQGALEALVIAIMPPDTDDSTDRTLLALENDPGASRSALLDFLADAHLDALTVLDVRPQSDGICLTLLEIDGGIVSGDTRLAALRNARATHEINPVRNAVIIGAYANPFGDAELDLPDL